MRKRQAEAEIEAQQKRRSAELALRVNTIQASKGVQIDNALKQLGVNSDICIRWFKYLQRKREVVFRGSLNKVPTAFKTCRTLAAKAIDPLLKSRKIYDDSRAVTDDPGGASSSQAEEVQIQTVLKHYGLDNPAKPTYWFAKGLILHMNPAITIRCDGAAALAFYHLCQEKGFIASIGLVRQGDPRWSGHWFLLAGVKDYLRKENINSLHAARTGNLKPSWCFVVDLWGASFQKHRTTVGYPAYCVAGDWPGIEILWTV